MKYNFCVLSEKNIRVDMYLSTLFSDLSRSYIQKIIDKGQVQLNGKIINKNIKISPKDEIIIEFIKEKLSEIKAEKMDFDIVYEDNEILILNKNPGINVHPVPGEDGNKNTLVNGILYHCSEKLPCINGVERPGIVHRLDKDTSGLIMIAKTDSMMNNLSKIISGRELGKYYLAIVNGKIKNKNFTIESYIGRDPNNRQKMTSKNPINPKIAITHGEVLDYIDDKYSLVKLKIETGRTHQIRVHLSSIGFPIIGDKVYANSKINREVFEKYGLERQALHAYKLNIKLYGKDFEFKADLKDDMKNIIGGRLIKKHFTKL